MTVNNGSVNIILWARNIKVLQIDQEIGKRYLGGLTGDPTQ